MTFLCRHEELAAKLIAKGYRPKIVNDKKYGEWLNYEFVINDETVKTAADYYRRHGIPLPKEILKYTRRKYIETSW